MFYSHTILARKSPLGTVWIAAHLERKIKKPQIDGIDIPTYAGPSAPPLARPKTRFFSFPSLCRPPVEKKQDLFLLPLFLWRGVLGSIWRRLKGAVLPVAFGENAVESCDARSIVRGFGPQPAFLKLNGEGASLGFVSPTGIAQVKRRRGFFGFWFRTLV